MLDLWLEFEAAETADAEFAKSMDRVLPVFKTMKTTGKLEASRYCKEKIEKRNAHLKSCAPALWDYVMQQLDVAVEKGWLSQ